MENERAELASKLFKEGYNCSQSVALAFADILPVDRDTLSRLSSSFGGGVGRLREVCGAVSGMAIVLGLLYGYEGPETGEQKQAHYERVQSCALELEKRFGSMVCRELLGKGTGHDAPSPSPRTESFYSSRPCEKIICAAAQILEEYIAEQKN